MKWIALFFVLCACGGSPRGEVNPSCSSGGNWCRRCTLPEIACGDICTSAGFCSVAGGCACQE